MGWIMGHDGVHRCPLLPFYLWPRRGRTATCEECGATYVQDFGGWRRLPLKAKPSGRKLSDWEERA